jgi:hypothetical protein
VVIAGRSGRDIIQITADRVRARILSTGLVVGGS